MSSPRRPRPNDERLLRILREKLETLNGDRGDPQQFALRRSEIVSVQEITADLLSTAASISKSLGLVQEELDSFVTYNALLPGVVVSDTLTTPPISPAADSCYIVAGIATGAWVGWENSIAAYIDGAWVQIAPQEGWNFWVNSNSGRSVYTGGNWVQEYTGLAEAPIDGDIYGRQNGEWVAITASSGGSVGSFTVTIPAGRVDSDLTNFPLRIGLRDMPASFWLEVDDGGGNIRAYAADGLTPIPHDCTICDTKRENGVLYVKTNIAAASITTIEITVESAGTAALAVDSTYGRNVVWADYEVVWSFPNTENRTGKAYTQTTGNVPYSEWTRSRYHQFTGSPHQGIAVDGTGRLITIDTNYLRRHSTDDLNTLLASNSTPVADTGLPVVNHCGDACIVGSELFVPLEEYPRVAANNQHIAVYDADTLAFIRSYDISANNHPADGIAYDGTDLWVVDWNDNDIYRYSVEGVLLETVTLSAPLINIDGIEVIEGLLYLSVRAADNPIYEVQTDGTVNGVIYNRPTNDVNEGLSYDGKHLWIMAGDGDAEELIRDPDRFDWVKLHYDHTWANISPISTAWTMAASVYWTSTTGDEQQAFLAFGTELDNSGRVMVAYDEGPDVVSMWNSSDLWQGSSFNPSTNATFRVAGSQNNTTRRKLWKDGQVLFTDAPISARPVSGLGKAEFIINASRTDGNETAEAYYQFVWLRHGEMSDTWMDADNINTKDPSMFYLPIVENADSSNVSDLPILNPGAETGDMTGWVVVGNFEAMSLVGSLGPFRGSYMFGGGVGASSSASQVVVIAANSIAKIDTGLAKMNLSWRQTSFDGQDEGDVEIEFLDGAGLSLGAAVGLGLSPGPAQEWLKREHVGVAIPVATRRVKINMKTNRIAGSYSNGHFDALVGAIY